MTKSLKCPKCPRTFSMPAHLARHLSGSHGVASARRAKKKRGRIGRPPKSLGRIGKRMGRPRKKMGRRGRPTGIVELASMSIEQLIDLSRSARDAARQKLSSLRSIVG